MDTRKFMVQGSHVRCGYGYRLWFLSDDWEMIASLKKHSMWGGVDKRYHDGNGGEIVSYEITPYDNDVTLNTVREILSNDGFEEITKREEKIAVFEKYHNHF